MRRVFALRRFPGEKTFYKIFLKFWKRTTRVLAAISKSSHPPSPPRAMYAAHARWRLDCLPRCHGGRAFASPASRRRRDRNHKRAIESGNSDILRLRSMECEVAPCSRRSHDTGRCRFANRSTRHHIWCEQAIPRQQGSALTSAQVRSLLATLESWQTCITNRGP